MSRKKKLEGYLRRSFGTNPMEGQLYYRADNRMDRVRMYHNNMQERAKEHWEKARAGEEAKSEILPESRSMIDSVTWDDLEMDQVFLRINHTQSYAGEQVLYRRLHHVTDDSDEKTRGSQSLQERLEYLEEHARERLEMETKLYAVGKYDGDYYLSTFLMNPDLWKMEGNWLIHLLQLLLVFFLVMSIGFDSATGVVGLLVVIIVNLLVYFRAKQKYEVYLESLGSFKKLYDFAEWMKKDSEKWNRFGSEKTADALKKLKKMSRLLVNFSSRRQGAMAGDLTSVFADYLFGITLIDISMFNWMMRKMENKQAEVMELFRFAGEVDSDISVLSYRKSLDVWCIPEKQERGIRAKGLAHPLLSHPVENDFLLAGRAMITGANASGKSTFMKALAINVILAQTVYTCTAEEFALESMYVMTCMSLRDDVVTGESYYVREAKYLKRMLDAITNDGNLLCVIDEILKGTNTTERIAASKAILSYIAGTDCFALVATHDMELTEDSSWKKYYFDSRMEEGDIWFDYKIHEGIGGKSNAIALLEVLGYPKEIVRAAKNAVAISDIEDIVQKNDDFLKEKNR